MAYQVQYKVKGQVEFTLGASTPRVLATMLNHRLGLAGRADRFKAKEIREAIEVTGFIEYGRGGLCFEELA